MWLTTNQFFVSVSNHLPKVDPSILDDLNNDYCSDFTIDPEEVANRLASINAVSYTHLTLPTIYSV